MPLQFGRETCGYRAIAENREWLVTNGIGGYACGTVAGLLTRHYHGLLIAALKPPLNRTLLLTKLDEQATYDEQAYALHCDRWADGTISGHGYRHLERFTLEGTTPVWTFALGDALLQKRIWMEPGANTTYIQYHLIRGNGPVHLTVKALLNYRSHDHSTRAQDGIFHLQPVAHGLTVTAFPAATPYHVVADRGTCTRHHTWHHGYNLAVERYRGIDPYDDHLHGATFAAELALGQTWTIAATTASPDTLDLATALARRQQHEQDLLDRWHAAPYLSAAAAPPWIAKLVLAADQFVVGRAAEREVSGKTVIAGYPWFGDWGRDTMIALPGLAIATGRPEIARPILRTFAQYLDQGMLPNTFPEAGEAPHYNTVDAVLWYFEAVRTYYTVSGDRALLAELFPALVEISRWHQRGTRFQIHLDDDGLIYAGESGVQLTWMDAKVGDWVVTPRIGKPVEINALWYNALLTLAFLADQLEQPSNEFRHLAAQTHRGFQRFWSDVVGHCFDVLDTPDGDDPSLRPNQIFAVALPTRLNWPGDPAMPPKPLGPPLLTPPQQQAIVDTVARHLLTSYGLRSLAPQHPDYNPRYGGNLIERDGAYHQGTVWGWLIGPFVQAHLQVYQDPELARSFLQPFADHLRDGCIGTLSEIFDGHAPFTPRGAFAQAWTVSEVLRVWSLTDLSGSHEPD